MAAGWNKVSHSHTRVSRIVHAALMLAVLLAIGWRVYGYFATTESDVRAARRAQTHSSEQQWREAAGRAFATEDWGVVVDSCERIVANDPDNMQAWARLAHALLMQKHYDPAIAAYLRVCHAEGRPRQWALYNIAAAYALKGEKAMALDYLREAVEAGYRQLIDERPVAEDPDFHTLADDPEFQRLAELTKPVSQRDVYRQLDFIVGRWTLMSRDSRRVGAAEFSLSSGGYAIVGHCADNTRATQATVMTYYEPVAAVWKQVWLDDHGAVLELTGQSEETRAVTFHGDWVLADGRRFAGRVRWNEEPDGRVHLVLSMSTDAGNRWGDLLDAHLVPRGSRQTVTRPPPSLPPP